MDRFFAPRSIHALVACRIIFGLALFFSYLNRVGDVSMLFGPDGIGGASALARSPGLSITRALEAPIDLLTRIDSIEVIWLLYGTLLVSSLCFAVGLRTRTMGVIALVLHALFHARNGYAFYGWPIMFKPFMVYVLLAPVHRFGSLDAWLARARQPLVPIADWVGPAYPVRLMQVHLCCMYAEAGWSRLTDPGWLRGEMVYLALQDDRYRRLAVDWTPLLPLLRVPGWIAFVAEPLAPLLLWLPGIGPAWAVLLLLLHMGLEVGANIGMWQYTMMGALLVFLPPSWLEWVFELPSRLFRRTPAAV